MAADKALNRREFLKLSGLLSPLAFSSLSRPANQADQRQNIVVILFDAWTAANIQLYDYPRETMPNLARLAETAIVYHQHRSGGSWTTPGTASLLSGTYPWTHHALQVGNRVRASLADHNIFRAFDGYQRIAAAQNPLAYELLLQFREEIDDLLPFSELFVNHDFLISELFINDRPSAQLFKTLGLENRAGRGNLLLLPLLNRWLRQQTDQRVQAEFGAQFPEGVPSHGGGNYFTLENVVAVISSRLIAAVQPFFAYFHLWPPHVPYRPTDRQSGRFAEDGLNLPEKPDHPLHVNVPPENLYHERQMYDEYLGYVDEQFATLFANLEQRGLLANTTVLLTADHGELFERGILTHFTASLNDPVMHIPLLIWQPGQTERVDIHSPTSAVDVLPTLMHLVNRSVPPWAEGQLMRPFAPGPPDASRGIFTVDAKTTAKERPLERVSVAMVRGPFKLIYYGGFHEAFAGYPAQHFELFDILHDPEELEDLLDVEIEVAESMKAELLARLATANEVYL